MKKGLQQYKRLIRYSFILLLILGQTVVFYYCWMSEYNSLIILPFVQKGNMLMALYYFLMQLMFLYNFDGLKFGYFKKLHIFISQILSVICTNIMIYLPICLLSARFVTVTPIILMTVFDIIFSICVTSLSEFVFSQCFPAKRLLVIYDEYQPDIIVEKLNSRKDKFSVEKTASISLGLDEISKLINTVEGVVIFDVHSEMRNKLIKMCFDKNIRTYSTSKVSDTLIRGAESIHLFDTPLLLFRNQGGLTFEQRFVKRAMDIIISLLLIVILSPFMLLSAIAVKLYDGGPVFFRQKRSTIGGRTFMIHKFRSMIVDAEKDGNPIPATESDPRITPVGKVLRFTRMDELPQLFDILKGDMSLVGPRPERVEHTRKYTKEIPEFPYRLKVRAGLTGLAQLYGKYNTSAYDKLQLDLMYIQNYSLLLDIRLLFMTLKVIFIKESTEGFSKEKSLDIKNCEK